MDSRSGPYSPWQTCAVSECCCVVCVWCQNSDVPAVDVHNTRWSRGNLGTVINDVSTADDSMMCRDDEISYDPSLDVIIPTDEDEVAEEEEEEEEEDDDDDDDDAGSDNEDDGGRSVDAVEVDYDYSDDDDDDDDGDKDDDDEPEIETEIM